MPARRASDPTTNGCESPRGCWKLNTVPLEEQSTFLTSESSLQLPIKKIKYKRLINRKNQVNLRPSLNAFAYYLPESWSHDLLNLSFWQGLSSEPREVFLNHPVPLISCLWCLLSLHVPVSPCSCLTTLTYLLTWLWCPQWPGESQAVSSPALTQCLVHRDIQ